MMEEVPKIVFIFLKVMLLDLPSLEKLDIISEWITSTDILNENLEVHGHFAVDLKSQSIERERLTLLYVSFVRYSVSMP